MNTHISRPDAFRRALSVSGIPVPALVPVLVLVLGLTSGHPAWAQWDPKGPAACTTSSASVAALIFPPGTLLGGVGGYCQQSPSQWFWRLQGDAAVASHPALAMWSQVRNICTQAGGIASTPPVLSTLTVLCRFPVPSERVTQLTPRAQP